MFFIRPEKKQGVAGFTDKHTVAFAGDSRGNIGRIVRAVIQDFNFKQFVRVERVAHRKERIIGHSVFSHRYRRLDRIGKGLEEFFLPGCKRFQCVFRMN